MSQHSEERVPDDVVSLPTPARVVPFERPQSELQKAVQQRAQEAIERERERAASQRRPPWARALVLVLAVIPVFLLFSAAIAFVGAMRQFNAAVFESTSSADQQAAPTATQTPAESSSEPEVVMIQPYAITPPPRQDDGKSTVTPEAR